MRRASLVVACIAIIATPAFAQSVTRPNEVPAGDVSGLTDRDGAGNRDVVSPIVVVAEPVAVPQKTRSLVSRSSTRGRIDFNNFWQTGVYQ
jgi:hypothetical protein